MAEDLRVQSFCAAHLRDVQDFTCGDKPWQVEVAQWIKGESADNALKRMAQGTEVWLYRNANGEVVGYGSLGKSEWSWPPPKGPKQAVSIIPFFGVQTRFQGEPKNSPRNARFAYQILMDLVAKAAAHGTSVLGLFVDEDNTRAIKFYELAGFMSLTVAGKKYRRMFLYLHGTAEGNVPVSQTCDQLQP
jgi:ribosomal protein S18 acetylase RimI-like enzyme